MARIKHIAVMTADVPKLADFYKNVFGLKEVSRGKRSIYLSDGYINMAILPAGDGQEGIDHFGFEVEDLQKMAMRGLVLEDRPIKLQGETVLLEVSQREIRSARSSPKHFNRKVTSAEPQAC